jgi:hypothetical protein
MSEKLQLIPRRTSPEMEKRARTYVINHELKGMTKKDAAADAGYAPSSSTSEIDKSVLVRVAKMEICEQRDFIMKNMQCQGFSFFEVAERIKNRAKSSKSEAIQTDNEKLLISMLGYNAPQKIEVKSLSLIADLGGLSADDLDALNNIGKQNGK